MTPTMLAALIAVGAVSMLGVGVLVIMKPKRITMVDYPELPAPKPDEQSGGPTMNA